MVATLTATSIASVSPNPRNTSVSSLDVTFSLPITSSSLSAGAIVLTDNGQAVSTSGVSLSVVSGDTYTIDGLSGLTAAGGDTR